MILVVLIRNVWIGARRSFNRLLATRTRYACVRHERCMSFIEGESWILQRWIVMLTLTNTSTSSGKILRLNNDACNYLAPLWTSTSLQRRYWVLSNLYQAKFDFRQLSESVPMIHISWEQISILSSIPTVLVEILWIRSITAHVATCKRQTLYIV